MKVNFTDEQLKSAGWVLTDALYAPEDSTVLIVHDEATSDLATCFIESAQTLNLEMKKLLVPNRVQGAFGAMKRKTLDEPIRDAVFDASCVVLLQAATTQSMHFRFALLKSSTRWPGKRIASMPGVSLDNLHLCRCNLEVLEERCRLFADRLLWGRNLTLETFDAKRKPFILALPIGEFTPRPSTGRVPDRGWCNVPSGETFIVPNFDPQNRADAASGEVVINGSMLNYPIPADEQLLLRIDEGKVQFPPEYRGSNIGRFGAKLLYDSAGHEVRENCTIVSELGIGLNESIKDFTGRPIFDEKILGTVHVGLGNSSQFGGPTKCEMHNDFVTTGANLSVDSTPLIINGVPCLEHSKVFPNWADITTKFFDPSRPIARGEENWRDVRIESRFAAEREWISDRSGGPVWTRIGNDETARVACKLLWFIEDQHAPINLKTFQNYFNDDDTIPTQAIQPVLELLLRFGLISQE